MKEIKVIIKISTAKQIFHSINKIIINYDKNFGEVILKQTLIF